MAKTSIRVKAPVGVDLETPLAASFAWSLTQGQADWVLALTQTRCLLSLELHYAPAGTGIHYAALPADERSQTLGWARLLRRFALTRLIQATVLSIRSRDMQQINRGFQDYVEPDMPFVVVRKNQRIAELRITSVQEGDSLALVTDWGRGIKPEDTAIGLWVP